MSAQASLAFYHEDTKLTKFTKKMLLFNSTPVRFDSTNNIFFCPSCAS
jgi:hypothetical protein